MRTHARNFSPFPAISGDLVRDIASVFVVSGSSEALGAKLGQRAVEQPGDVRLRDPDRAGDLRFGQSAWNRRKTIRRSLRRARGARRRAARGNRSRRGRRARRRWLDSPRRSGLRAVGGHQSLDLAHVGVERGRHSATSGARPSEATSSSLVRPSSCSSAACRGAAAPGERPECGGSHLRRRAPRTSRTRRPGSGRSGLDAFTRPTEPAWTSVVELLTSALRSGAPPPAPAGDASGRDPAAVGIAKTPSRFGSFGRYRAPDMSFSTDVAFAPCADTTLEAPEIARDTELFLGSDLGSWRPLSVRT